MPFDYLSAIPLAINAFGSFDAARRAKAAAQARDALLNQYSGQLDSDYNQMQNTDARNLMGQTGVGGDAIQALGRNLGGAMAGAGIYNSSATAGALAQGTADTQTALGQLAATNRQNEQGQLSRNRNFLFNARMGIANNNYNDSRESLDSSRSGLASGLGAFTQRLLAQNGTPNANRMGAAVNGKSSVLDYNPQNAIDQLGNDTLYTNGVPGMGSANYGFQPSSRKFGTLRRPMLSGAYGG